MERRTDWYAHPAYYEAIFGEDTVRELDFLDGVNRTLGTGGDLFFEPACGAGRLIAEGAKRGRTMIGCDVSEPMLAFARDRLPAAHRKRAKLFQARMQDFAPAQWRGKVDLAFNLVSTFRYLPTEADAVAHLRCVRALLKPGGVYALGFHLTDYDRARPEHERWVGRVGREKVVCNTHEWLPDRKLRRSRMRNRLRITGPKKDWLIETEWMFRTYDAPQVQALLRAGGFRLKALHDFDYDLGAPRALPGDDRLDWLLILTPTAG